MTNFGLEIALQLKRFLVLDAPHISRMGAYVRVLITSFECPSPFFCISLSNTKEKNPYN
jgi:hypothetical protein